MSDALLMPDGNVNILKLSTTYGNLRSVTAGPDHQRRHERYVQHNSEFFAPAYARLAAGIAGYGNVPDSIGASNARNFIRRPTLYDAVAKAGSRFSTNFPSSKIERLYHSSATLLPDGRIWISGSNPNDGVTSTT
jgi:hypothetical protein